MAANQTECPHRRGLNKFLSSNFCWPRKVNHEKIMKGFLMCTEKQDLILKIFTNKLNAGFLLRARVEKAVH